MARALYLLVVLALLPVVLTCDTVDFQLLDANTNCGNGMPSQLKLDPDFNLSLNDNCELVMTGCMEFDPPMSEVVLQFESSYDEDDVIVSFNPCELEDEPNAVSELVRNMLGNCPVGRMCGTDVGIEIPNVANVLPKMNGVVNATMKATKAGVTLSCLNMSGKFTPKQK